MCLVTIFRGKTCNSTIQVSNIFHERIWSKLLNVGCRSPTKDRINLPPVLFSSWLRVRCGFSLAHMVAVHTSPYTRPTCQPEFACAFIPASTRWERKEGAPVSVCSSPFVAVGRWWLRARRLEAEIWGVEIPLLLSRLPDISAAAVSQSLRAERGGERAELK